MLEETGEKHCEKITVDCSRYIELITDYLENDLSAEEKSLWEKHFSDCPECKNFFESFKSSLEAVEFLAANCCPRHVKQRLEGILVDTARTRAGQAPPAG